MDLFSVGYILIWSLVCLTSIIILVKDKSSFELFHRDYWRFLMVPWKVVTFAGAFAAMVILAPFSGDPTWDYIDASFMSILTFVTAPWAIGVLYRSLRRGLPAKKTFVAFCAWMFSASWSYDLYLFIRDGHYPVTWFVNILASSVLYIPAGLLWNLDWRERKGIIFSFTEDNWLVASTRLVFKKIFWYAFLFIVFVGILIMAYVYQMGALK